MRDKWNTSLVPSSEHRKQIFIFRLQVPSVTWLSVQSVNHQFAAHHLSEHGKLAFQLNVALFVEIRTFPALQILLGLFKERMHFNSYRTGNLRKSNQNVMNF